VANDRSAGLIGRTNRPLGWAGLGWAGLGCVATATFDRLAGRMEEFHLLPVDRSVIPASP
jgi:hypothetical protein